MIIDKPGFYASKAGKCNVIHVEEAWAFGWRPWREGMAPAVWDRLYGGFFDNLGEVYFSEDQRHLNITGPWTEPRRAVICPACQAAEVDCIGGGGGGGLGNGTAYSMRAYSCPQCGVNFKIERTEPQPRKPIEAWALDIPGVKPALHIKLFQTEDEARNEIADSHPSSFMARARLVHLREVTEEGNTP